MLNLNKSFLSDSDKTKIQTWLSLPAADLFKGAIASEIAQAQVDAVNLYTSKDRNDLNIRRANEQFKKADDLQCVLEAMDACSNPDYQFIAVTINP